MGIALQQQTNVEVGAPLPLPQHSAPVLALKDDEPHLLRTKPVVESLLNAPCIRHAVVWAVKRQRGFEQQLTRRL